MFHKEVETSHSEEHEQGVGTSILGEADVVGHEGQREGAGEGDGGGELPCEEVDHGDREHSEDQWDDPKVSFWFGEGIELVGKNKEERRMKIRGILLIELDLAFEIIPGVIEGMDLIHPEGLLIENVEAENKACNETENKNDDLFLCYFFHPNRLILTEVTP